MFIDCPIVFCHDQLRPTNQGSPGNLRRGEGRLWLVPATASSEGTVLLRNLWLHQGKAEYLWV